MTEDEAAKEPPHAPGAHSLAILSGIRMQESSLCNTRVAHLVCNVASHEHTHN